MNGRQYAAARKTLFERTLLILATAWVRLGSWRDRDVAGFQRQALPVLAGAQQTLASMTAVRVARSATLARGRSVAPPVIPRGLVTDVRDGVSVAEVYRRPFEQTWYGLSKGEDVDDAVERGKVRLLGLADLDLQVAETLAAQSAMEQTGATWWRRVPQGAQTCLLCLVASTRAYRTSELKPVHPGCDCIQEEQFTPRPGDGVTDPELLARAYDAVRGQTGRVQTSAEVLRALLADMTDTHSEVGPILVAPRGTRIERARVTSAA